MVSGLDLARAPRRARLTARKKGSGYENEIRRESQPRTQALCVVLGLRGLCVGRVD